MLDGQSFMISSDYLISNTSNTEQDKKIFVQKENPDCNRINHETLIRLGESYATYRPKSFSLCFRYGQKFHLAVEWVAASKRERPSKRQT